MPIVVLFLGFHFLWNMEEKAAGQGLTILQKRCEEARKKEKDTCDAAAKAEADDKSLKRMNDFDLSAPNPERAARLCREAKIYTTQVCGAVKLAQLPPIVDEVTEDNGGMQLLGNCSVLRSNGLHVTLITNPDHSINAQFIRDNYLKGKVYFKSNGPATFISTQSPRRSLTFNKAMGKHKSSGQKRVVYLAGYIPKEETLGNQITMLCNIDQNVYAQLNESKGKHFLARRDKYRHKKGRVHRQNDAVATRLPRAGGRKLLDGNNN